MAVPTPLTQFNSIDEFQAWESLRRAIATSSGFQRWRQQSDKKYVESDRSSDTLVEEYLRETLETLAY